MIRLLLSIWLLLAFDIYLLAQSLPEILISPNEIELPQKRSGIIATIENLKQITISYSGSQFADETIKVLPEQAKDLKSFLEFIFSDYHISLTAITDFKYVLTMKEAKINISGFVLDSLTGEVLPGAIIHQPSTGNFTSTDEKGFFYFECKPGFLQLQVHILGYSVFDFEEKKDKIIFLQFHAAQ